MYNIKHKGIFVCIKCPDLKWGLKEVNQPMTEARFIKTVTFGGYDKAGVIKEIEHLNRKIYSLRNELEESKMLLDAYKNGTVEQEAYESILADERDKLTKIQAHNDMLSEKLEVCENENKQLTEENDELKKVVIDLRSKLKAAESLNEALNSENDAAALGSVFIEAQKSASMLEEVAKAKCAELEKNAKELAVSIVEDANIDAEQVKYKANQYASDTITAAKNNAEEMNTASINLRAVVLKEVNKLKSEMASIQNFIQSFYGNSTDRLSVISEILVNTEDTLVEGGIPEYRDPKLVEAEVLEKPVTLAEKYERDAAAEVESKQKKQQSLDKLKQMADLLGGKKKDSENKPDKSEKTGQNNKASTPKAENAEKKKGKLDLAAIAAKAKNIDKK